MNIFIETLQGSVSVPLFSILLEEHFFQKYAKKFKLIFISLLYRISCSNKLALWENRVFFRIRSDHLWSLTSKYSFFIFHYWSGTKIFKSLWACFWQKRNFSKCISTSVIIAVLIPLMDLSLRGIIREPIETHPFKSPRIFKEYNEQFHLPCWNVVWYLLTFLHYLVRNGWMKQYLLSLQLLRVLFS